VSTTLRAGTCVYRVVEDDPPGAGLHTWKVACVAVEKASARQIRLARRFDGLASIWFDPDALGRLFFETPLQAIQFFLTARRLEMESLERKKAEAARAIAWAAGQPGMVP
jgi:hypothetical protein